MASPEAGSASRRTSSAPLTGHLAEGGSLSISGAVRRRNDKDASRLYKVENLYREYSGMRSVRRFRLRMADVKRATRESTESQCSRPATGCSLLLHPGEARNAGLMSNRKDLVAGSGKPQPHVPLRRGKVADPDAAEDGYISRRCL